MNARSSPVNPVAEEIIALIAKQKSIAPEQIGLDNTLEELAIDSLDRVSLSFDIEEKYGIQIPDNKLDQIRTVKDMVDGIEELLHQKSSSAAQS